MSLSKDDVLHVANLAHIDLSESQILQMQGELNDIFKMIEEIRAVNTDGVEPMLHPHDPETCDSMFLVPQYVES